MQSGGKRVVIKPEKTKFRKNEDGENKEKKNSKPKHHDRSYYRLLRQEKEDYAL